MSNIGHGHVIPSDDGMKARCGGPGMCSACSREQALLMKGAEVARSRRQFSVLLIGGLANGSRIRLPRGERMVYVACKAPSGEIVCEPYQIEVFRIGGGLEIEIGRHAEMSAEDAFLALVDCYPKHKETPFLPAVY